MIAPLLMTLGIALVLALLFAPFEALRWWATQGARESRATAEALREIRRSIDERRSTAQAQAQVDDRSCYVVYLSGVGAVDHEVSPEGEGPLLDDLRTRMPDTLLISDVYPYSPSNLPLLSGRWSSWWWRLIERWGRGRFTSVLQFLVYLRNVLQFAVSADDRYGPMYSLGVAGVILDRLQAAGYRPGCGRPVVLFGWSGGAQIALSAAWYLTGAGMPVYLLSLGGVITSDPGLDRITHAWHLKGTRDWVQGIGALFPGRWPGRSNSFWARAVADGRITIHTVGAMGHLGRGSYLSRSRTADGRTCREVVADTIVDILRGAGLTEAPPSAAEKTT